MRELQEFFDECQFHDWFYHYSDDFSVYNQGEIRADQLRKRADQLGPEGQKILSDWQQFYFSGPNFGKPQHPKPIRPE